VQHQEIETSTYDHQVITKPIIDISILADTSPVDEHQTKVQPSEHMKEVQEPVLEKIHTTGCLGNTLTWGKQQILMLDVDEASDI
jgi:hypothetical protein